MSTRTRPRRKTNKRRTRRKRKMLIPRNLPLGGFPNSQIAKLKYVQNFVLDAGAGTFALTSVRANSIFDPDQTGVGHQPSNHDKLATIYDTYTVIGSQMRVNWVPLSSTVAEVPGVLIVHLSESGNDLATAHAAGGIANMLEQPRIKRTWRYVGIATVDDSNKPLIKNFSARKFFGIKNFRGVHPYSADFGANPTEGAFYEVAIASPDDIVNPSSLTVRIEVTYICLLTEPKMTDAS